MVPGQYGADVLARLSVQRLWISVGNDAESYRLAAGFSVGPQPWSEMYGYRSVLAQVLPEEINDDRVWFGVPCVERNTVTIQSRRTFRRLQEDTGQSVGS